MHSRMHERVRSAGVNVIGRQSSFAQRDSNRLHDWSAEYSGANVHGSSQFWHFWQRTYDVDGVIATVTRHYHCLGEYVAEGGYQQDSDDSALK